jgi:hypothetical protein
MAHVSPLKVGGHRSTSILKQSEIAHGWLILMTFSNAMPMNLSFSIKSTGCPRCLKSCGGSSTKAGARVNEPGGYRANGIDPNDPSSMIVIDGDHVRQDSDAVLSIYEGLGYRRMTRLMM